MSVYSLIGWAILLGFAFYYTFTHALRYFNFSDPAYANRLKGFENYPMFAPILLTHIMGGVIALLIGSVQFFPEVRTKYVRIHRLVGVIYVGCIALSGIAAIYLAIAHNLPIQRRFVWGIGALSMAFAWFLTTGMAFWSIKQKNFVQHQEWMVRSYVLTCNFILYRIILYSVLAFDSFPYKDEVSNLTIWVSWIIPLLVTEVILQARKIQHQSKGQAVRQVV